MEDHLTTGRKLIREAKAWLFRAQDREVCICDHALALHLLSARRHLEAADRRLQALLDAREIEATLEAAP